MASELLDFNGEFDKYIKRIHENGHQQYDAHPDVWYLGGYFCGRANPQHIPPKSQPQELMDAWKLGYEDGKGDKENGW